MRYLLAVLVIWAAATAPVIAQDTAPPTTQEQNDGSTAARAALQAAFIDSGALSAGTTAAFAAMAPQIRQQWAGTSFYATLTSAHQLALNHYLDTPPPSLIAEIMNGAPALLDRFAPRLAAILTETELADLTTFAKSPHGARMLVDGVLQGARANPQESTPLDAADTAAFARFAQTPGGRAFNEHASQIGGLLHDMGFAAVAAPAVRQRLLSDLCALLEDQCPVRLRDGINGI